MQDKFNVGLHCWVDMLHMRGMFPGDVMYAEVVEGHRKPQEGMCWVKQLPTPAMPNAGEEDGWVSEQPLVLITSALVKG